MLSLSWHPERPSQTSSLAKIKRKVSLSPPPLLQRYSHRYVQAFIAVAHALSPMFGGKMFAKVCTTSSGLAITKGS